MRYRKKPVVIEAKQFRADNGPSLAEWCGGTWFPSVSGNTQPLLVIPTLEGDHQARPGDWIIRGVQGEFYPCKPGIFAATYEPAEDTP